MKEKNKVYIALLIVLISIIVCLILLYKDNGKTSDFAIKDESSAIENAKKFGDDVIGWIRVEGTNIDMALIQRNDVANVSRDDYDFAWTNSFPDEKSNHLTFVSHNIRNVSSNPIMDDDTMTRFEQLMNFIYYDFVKENQFIAITDENNETSIYRVFGVSLLDEGQYASYMDTYTLDEQEDYIKKAKKESMYDMGVDVDKNDELLTLYTCTRFYGATSNYSFRVDARKLREEEKMKYASVETNKNYDKILKRMKEGENYENQEA